jgi:transposase
LHRRGFKGAYQTAEGLPIYHELVSGNTAEVKTLKPTLEKVLKRFPIKRIIVVADWGLLSTNTLTELQAMRLPRGAPLEFILAVPGRRYSDFKAILQPFHEACCQNIESEVVGETPWQDLRLVIAHDPYTAAEKSAKRAQTIADLEAQSQQWAGKVDAQDGGYRSRGRKLLDGGVTVRF